MKREGRSKEWFATVRDVCAEKGVRFGQGKYDAMVRMGYEGPKKEKEIHAAYQAGLKHNELVKFISENTKEWNKELRMSDFEEALKDLPATADPAVEMDWVGAHPAMMRSYDLPPEKKVKVTADDILSAPHGPAPSRRCVNLLRQYVDVPRKFFDQWVSESKKAKGDGKPEEVSNATPEVDEINELLASIAKKAE